MAETMTRRSAWPFAAFTAGAAVSLLLGVYGARHEPTFQPITTFGLGSMIEMKVVLSTAVGLLAIAQVVTALWVYGVLRLRVPRWLGRAHRVTGVVTVLVSLPVAYHCLWSLGFQAGELTPLRVVVHSVAGCLVYGALVAKVIAVHARRAPGWLLPVAGGLLFTTIVTVVWTSAVWYVGENGWPSGAGYP